MNPDLAANLLGALLVVASGRPWKVGAWLGCPHQWTFERYLGPWDYDLSVTVRLSRDRTRVLCVLPIGRR